MEAILSTIGQIREQLQAPVVLMSYLNPLAKGLHQTVAVAKAAGVSGFIVPDLPDEESGPFRSLSDAHDMALIPHYTGITDRVQRLCRDARGSSTQSPERA